MKKVSKRILALLLTALMLTSCVQLNVFAADETTSEGTTTSSTVEAVVGDSSVLENANATTLSLAIDKEDAAYTTVEPIIVTATGSGDAWVGLFSASEVTVSGDTYTVATDAVPVYQYSVAKEDDGIAHLSGQAYDIKSYGTYNDDNTAGVPTSLSEGSYALVLLSDATATSGLGKTITVTNGVTVTSAVADCSFSMSKTTFVEGEEIYVKAVAPDANAWIGAFPDGGSSYTVWAYINDGDNETTFDLISDNDSSNSMPAGKYTLKLFDDGGQLDLVGSIDITIIPKAYDNDSVVLKTDKSTYTSASKVTITAKTTSGSGSGAFIQLYNSTNGSPLATSYFTYDNGMWLHNQESFKLTDALEGATALGEGSYSLVMYADGTYAYPLRSTYFTISSTDTTQYSGSLEVSQTTFNSKDDISIKANLVDGNSSAWVALFPKGYSRSQYTTSKSAGCYGWNYIYQYNGQETTLKTILGSGAKVELEESDLVSGSKYDLVLFDGSFTPVDCITLTVDDSVAIAGSVSSSKTEYEYGEDIYVIGSHTGIDGSGGAKVALAKPDYAADEYVFYYVLNNQAIGQPVLLQDTLNLGTVFMESGQPANPYQIAQVMTPGTYELRLITGESVSVVETITIKDFKDDSNNITYTTPKLLGLAYEIDDYTDGFANGTVTVKADNAAYLKYTAAYNCELYWGDADGNKLKYDDEEYQRIARFPITSEYTSYKLTGNTLIPPGAKTIIAYGSIGRNVISTHDNVILSEGITADLTNAKLNANSVDNTVEVQTYEKFNSTNYVEFQSVTDTHVHDIYDLYGSEADSLGSDIIKVIAAAQKDAIHFTYDEASYDKYGNLTASSTVTDTKHNSNYRALLADVDENSKNSIGIIVNGDIADYSVASNNGTLQSYRYGQFTNFFTTHSGMKNEGYDLPNLYANLGNHDGCSAYDGTYNYIKAVNQYQTNPVGLELTASKPYYDFWIDKDGKCIDTSASVEAKADAYHFIILANDSSIGGSSGTLSATQAQWLDDLLAEDEENYPEKPVFLFHHNSIANTVSGSQDGTCTDGTCSSESRSPGWGANFTTDSANRLKAVMSKYDNIMMFSGHTHWDLYSEDNMYTGTANTSTCFNAASIGYLWDEFYKNNGEGLEGAQGYNVRIYDDGTVLVLGRDYVNQQYIPAAMFVVELYNDDQFDVENMSIDLNTTEEITVTGTKAESLKATNKLSYESLNPEVATVDADGNVTAVSYGSAEIRVIANGDDTNVVTKKTFTVTVENPNEAVLGDPVNLGDFSAYIHSLTENSNVSTKRYLTLSNDKVGTTENGDEVRYSIFDEKYAEATSLDINKRKMVLNQFWDFELQDDGTYIIYNTYTNVSHNNGTNDGYNLAYALSGNGAAYDAADFMLCEPTGDGDPEPTDNATQKERDDYISGDHADYYKWYIFQDSKGQYYLKCKANGKFLNLWPYNSGATNYGSLQAFMSVGYENNKCAFEFDKISDSESIKMNLFDYGSYITALDDEDKVLDFVNARKNSSGELVIASNAGYVDDSIISPSYTGYNRPDMNTSLDDEGYPVVANLTYDSEYVDTEKSKKGSLKYLFDEDMTYITKDGKTEGGLSVDNYTSGEYTSVRYGVGDGTGTGLFRKDESTNTYSYNGINNAAYFDVSNFYQYNQETKQTEYTPAHGENFQLYDYKIRVYDEWYNKEVEGKSSVVVLDDGTKPDNGYTITLGNLSDSTEPDYTKDAYWVTNNLMSYRAYAQNGEFLPFNLGHAMSPNIGSGGSFWSNTTDNNTSAQYYPYLPAYYNDVNVTNAEALNQKNETNMWFGMNFEFDFQQLNGGKVDTATTAGETTTSDSGDDMVFKFTGDDDVWVYIDDILVLDIGGIHAACYGEINFATGKVIHPVTNLNYHYEEMNLLDKYVQAYMDAKTNQDSALWDQLQGIADIIGGGTTIDELTEEDIRGYLVKTDDDDAYGIFTEDENGNYIFIDKTVHTFKFYYLERGAGVSTCSIEFNMSPIPTGVVSVANEVQTMDGVDLSDRDDDTYDFTVYGEKEGEAKLDDDTVFTYDVVDTKTGEIVESKLTVEQNGTFSLRGGQKAVFNMQVGTKYTFTEVRRSYQKIINTGGKINGVRTMVPNLAISLPDYIKETDAGVTSYNIEFINDLQATPVTLNYYDRIIKYGQPVDISSEATSLSYDYYGSEVQYDYADNISNSAELIRDAADKLGLSSVGNVLDGYKLFTSTEEAANTIKNEYVNYHTGANYIYTKYHTNQYGYTQDSTGYFADGSTGDKEEWVTVDSDANTISTWLFNAPKKYKVNTYGVVNDSTAEALTPIGDGKYINTGENSAKTVTAYYNQRMGQRPSTETSTDTTNYLSKYGIDGYTGVTATTNETATAKVGSKSVDVKFLYWAFDEEGTQIASTDLEYNQRIVKATDLYAVYGTEDTTVSDGVTLRANGVDTYADDNGVSRVRLNSVLNPYGTYGDSEKTSISDVAILYVNMADVSSIDDEIDTVKTQLEDILNNNTSYSISGTITLSDGSTTTKANGFRYDVVAKDSVTDSTKQVYLTSKNRVQFSTSFKAEQFESLSLISFAAVKIGDTWVLTDNYVDYT